MISVLVLCDDYWHPAETIQRGLQGFGQDEFQLDFVMNARDMLSVEMLQDYPVIMNCKGNQMTAANRNSWLGDGIAEVGVEELETYVRNGGGFLSVHSGNSFTQKDCKSYTDFVGNSFVKHPPRCEIEVVVKKAHPVTKNIHNFVIRDEHYELEHIADDAEILLESISETGGTQVAGYVRTMGNGKICMLSPGHILSVWENESFRQLLKNALKWCAEKG